MPLYRQLYSALRSGILDGRLRPGEKLPPTRTLAQSLSLSRATVAGAYEQLRVEGYIEGRAGSGTYVAPGIPSTSSAGRPMPGACVAPPLSRWGRNAIALSWPVEDQRARPPRYDLRPHGIAGDLFPWEAWQAAVDAALDDERASLLAYPPPAGLPHLRHVIAAHLRRFRAVDCAAGQVIVVNGAQQGLSLLAETFLEAGDPVAIEDPGYPTARRVLAVRGLRITRVPVDRDGLVLDELPRHPAPRLIHVTPSHQDPTGVTMSLSRRLALLDVAARGNGIVVEDDYDSEFRYEGNPVESLQSLDARGLTVYMGSFSKSILPGLRVGFLVVPEGLVQVVRAAKAIWDSGASALDQAALAHFIHSGAYERHIRRMRREYRARRDALLAALADEFGDRITVGERHGGLNVLISLHADAGEEEIVRGASTMGLAVRSIAGYYLHPPAEPTFLLGFGALPAGEAPRAARVLHEVVHRAESTAPSRG